MKKIYQNIALICLALIIGWVFFIPPFLDVAFEEDKAFILLNYFDFNPAKLAEVEILDNRDSTIWHIKAKNESMRLPDLMISLGTNHRSLNIEDSLLEHIEFVQPMSESFHVGQGQYLRVVIKKPGYDLANPSKSKFAEIDFETAKFVKQ